MSLLNNNNEKNRPNVTPIKSQIEPANAAELLALYDTKPKSKVNFKLVIIAVVFMMGAGLMLLQAGGKKGESSGQLLGDVLAQQALIVELAEKTQSDLKTTKVQNTLLSMSSVVSTDQKAVSAAMKKAEIVLPKGYKIPDELPASTTKKIGTAQISADYDAKIVEIIKDYLTVYQARMKLAYDKTKSPSVQAALDAAFKNSDEFIKEF